MRPRLRWVAFPAVGMTIALWSVATLAGLYSVGTSLTAASNGLPPSLMAPRSIALADPRRTLANSWAPQLVASRQRQASLLHRCDAGCVNSAASFVNEGKMARLNPAVASVAPNAVAPNAVAPNAVALVTAHDARFDSVVAKAKLSPQKLAAAFARASSHPAGAPLMLASLPSDARFAEPVLMPDQQGPASARFGPEVAEIERSSRLALALANALPLPSSPEVTAEGEVQVASLPPQDDMADSIPLPGRRPQAEIDQPPEAPKAQAPKAQSPKVQASKAPKAQAAKTKASKAQTAEAPPVEQSRTLSPRSSSHAPLPGVQVGQGIQASQGKPAKPAKPAKRSKAPDAEMLAYAKPDMPERGSGGAFGNLFTKPSMGGGVAVYDISAKTVYMPDGSRLEAHSGIGSMVDQPRYANRKNVGPTPPGTYDLKLRESRFHGVEAIRLTPTSGNNKYGRDGLLAHSYLLRGGRAESHGCVAFKDYARFLAAYKKGKIKRLVVVPRMSKTLTRVAQEGRGA
ncbi:DUF2778 domain-containing protein [Mesorhizobium sp. AR10]|uniref:tlde1 domain-containing protein n=1 Tax=Mesorhizobium sp. AR10 TaxID=2865839 RepID=UPI00216035C1|nr:tlde1 domain-containing protein [Mesorhizobium sp. AR10]UVK37898.1 DUF2778 domain-containing protein [Mesorhizobium sp. AR10]